MYNSVNLANDLKTIKSILLGIEVSPFSTTIFKAFLIFHFAKAARRVEQFLTKIKLLFCL